MVDEIVENDLLADDSTANVREHRWLVLEPYHRAVHIAGHRKESGKIIF